MDHGLPNEIRLARPDEVALIQSIEDDAGLKFGEIGIKDDFPGLTTGIIEQSITASLCFVSVDRDDAAIGFALCQQFPDALHLRELNVLRSAQGQGLGRALLARVVDEAKRRGIPGVTLTTFRDVPFNRPFYARHGFEEVTDLPGWLAEIRSHEREIGLDEWPRLAMRLSLA